MPAAAIIVNVTPFEPEWEGHVTGDFQYNATARQKSMRMRGWPSVVFFGADEPCRNQLRGSRRQVYEAARHHRAEDLIPSFRDNWTF